MQRQIILSCCDPFFRPDFPGWSRSFDLFVFDNFDIHFKLNKLEWIIGQSVSHLIAFLIVKSVSYVLITLNNYYSHQTLKMLDENNVFEAHLIWMTDIYIIT